MLPRNILLEYIESNALKYPGAMIGDATHVINYIDFFNQAYELGKQLKKQKYGIICKSQLNTAKAILACIYTGRTAVVLSERYGQLHNNKIIESINLENFITDDKLIESDTSENEFDRLSDVALIMCTSGTTGLPKGAMITFENLYTNISDINEYFNITNNDKILICRPLYHCAVLTGEFLISLVRGVDIFFVDEPFNPTGIINTIINEKITVMCGTPTMFFHLSRLIPRLSDPLHLNAIALSGECLTSGTAVLIRSCFPGTSIYNVYGLTEASPRVSYLSPDLFDRHPEAVGVFLKSVNGRIIDGELFIKGKNIMKGYYLNEKQNEWLATGDSAEIRDGLLYILGRKDDMIIRAGMNIYPKEIESPLKSDDNIDDIVAYGVSGNYPGHKIHIDIVTCLSVKDIHTICINKLPPHLIPDNINIVDLIEKNASGKTIRKKNK